jgi:ribosomal protein S18 acetylase RimI-like enzyme
VTVRAAHAEDRETLRALWQEFVDELDEPEYIRDTWEQAWSEMEGYIEREVALVAERGGEPVGYALARMDGARYGFLSDVYVRPEARREGVAKALIGAAVEALGARGADVLGLEVSLESAVARTVYGRLGFRERSLNLIAEVPALAARLARTAGESFGSVHVQTDNLAAVERAVRAFVPRLGGSEGSVIVPPRNGWTTVYDELCDRDSDALRRLARELSDRLGGVVIALGIESGQVVRYIAFERGRAVDEYLSVPEFHGPLPSGEVVALGANPTLLARLTGASPAAVRAVARTASSPAELPPAAELIAQIGEAIRLEGADHGYDRAREVPGALRIERT